MTAQFEIKIKTFGEPARWELYNDACGFEKILKAAPLQNSSYLPLHKQDILSSSEEVTTNSLTMFPNGLPHIDTSVLANRENYIHQRILDIVERIYWEWWLIETDGKKDSRKFMLSTRLDDEDDSWLREIDDYEHTPGVVYNALNVDQSDRVDDDVEWDLNRDDNYISFRDLIMITFILINLTRQAWKFFFLVRNGINDKYKQLSRLGL